MKHISVAIDGPAGAGKSTIAKDLAQKLACIYIDTGAMYRTVGYYCIQKGIDFNNEVDTSKALVSIQIEMKYENNNQVIYLNGEDVSEAIRTQEVAMAASKVATYADVRTQLVTMQRRLAESQSVVMDGRDIGTVVLPQATLKIFLTATAKERARRRYVEYEKKGIEADFTALIKEIEERDEQDSTRLVSPLKQAVDAICIDSTEKTIAEVVDDMYELVRKKEKEIE